jgi:hypothetical protein
MPFNLSQFALQRAVFEIRCAPAFLLWDRSRAIWRKIQRVHPTLKIKTAAPNQILIELPDQREGYVGIDKAYVAAYFPGTDLRPLKELAKPLFTDLLETLEIADLSRVGLRLTFEQVFKERVVAARAILDNTRLPIMKGKHFNIEGEMLDPDIAVRWEGEKIGCTVRAQVLQQKLDVEFPKEFRDLTSALMRPR